MGVIENRIDITELERSGGGGGGGTAASVSYDNTSSGLTATTVQGAIDEVLAESAGKDQISNRNLLDNPFFTVNQRGETSYAGSNKYTFDRWKLISAGGSESAASVSISDGVVTLDPDEDEYVLIAQAFEDYLYNSIAGKVLTMSVLLSDDSIITGTATFTDKDTSVEFGTGTGYAFGFYTGQGFRVVATSDLAIKAVKLEIGSVSTLDMDTAPNYAEELLKCQRYFQRLTTIPGRSYAPIGTGIVASNTGVRLFVPLIAPLRGVPTVSFNTDEGKIDLFGANTSNRIPVTNIAFNQLGNNSIILTITVESLQSYIEIGDACECWIMGSTDAYIDLSADL